jgi:hypothetical protein
MAKWQIDAMLDQSLSYISSNATETYICTAQPTDRANAIALTLIAASTPGFTGPADGDTNGRKLTINQDADNSITSTGDATHIALCSGTTLLYITTCTTQTLTSGGTVTIPAWDIEIADAA